jgi:hypothetical protein
MAAAYCTLLAFGIAWWERRNTCVQSPSRGSPIRPIFLAAVVVVAVHHQAMWGQFARCDDGGVWTPFYLPYARIVAPEAALQSASAACAAPNTIECLAPEDWTVLSAGALSSSKPSDVEAVRNGAAIAGQTGIIIFAVLRNVVREVPLLVANVESFLPFFAQVSVVLFENDSVDGTRGAIKDWAKAAKGYSVHLVGCEDLGRPDCEGLTKSDSWHFSEERLKKMAYYRNLGLAYIRHERFSNYSHVLTMDADLGISLSPLGVLHALGRRPDVPIAISGRSAYFGSLGALATVYDFSGFKPERAESGPVALMARFHKLYSKLIEYLVSNIMVRMSARTTSPFNTAMVVAYTRSQGEFVRVQSAFNGAALYPRAQIVGTDSSYQSCEEGVTNEHIAFNEGLISQKQAGGAPGYMLMSNRWVMYTSPLRPGGPRQSTMKKLVAVNAGTVPINIVVSITMELLGQTSCCLLAYKLVTGAWATMSPARRRAPSPA